MRSLPVAGLAMLALLTGCAQVEHRTAPAIVPGSCAPVYPSVSRRMEEQGSVVVRFLISPQGTLLQSQVATSSGHPRLDAAALEVLPLCKFTPALINGRVDPEPQWGPNRFTWKLEAVPEGH
ncbi:MAG TPA: energy transducer TonB [Magnetospirillaceae bacterium]|nr:energy transducer TonB [Magnetospirillaceae bacterium]